LKDSPPKLGRSLQCVGPTAGSGRSHRGVSRRGEAPAEGQMLKSGPFWRSCHWRHSMSHTKKAGTAGRFGARYGGLARKQVATIEKVQKAAHPCERCGHASVFRESTAIWTCRKCGFSFAGGAYVPQTGAGE